MLGIGQADVSARRIARRLAAPIVLVLGVSLALLGTPAGAMFRNVITVSSGGAMASSPHIATDTGNNALAVWTEDDSGTERVRAAVRPAGGDVELLGFLSAASGKAYQPVVAFDEHDNAVAVWTWYESPDEGATGHVQAAFRPAGGTFGPPQTISAGEPGANYYEPQIDVDESATLVWTREGPDTSLSVQAAFRAKDGSFGAPQTLSGPAGGYEPRVAIDERGNSLAVWTAGDALTVQSAFRPRTGAWSSATPISTAGHEVFSPRVTFDRRNNAMAVWAAVANPSDRSFIQASLRPAGESFATPETISDVSGSAFDPQIAFDKRDNALVAWARSDGSNDRIETRFRPRDGSFGAHQVVSPAGEDAFEPRIAVDESAAVVWSIHAGENPSRVQGAFRRKGGTFGGAQTLSEPGDSSFEPELAVDELGNVLAVWTRTEFTGFPVVQLSFRPRVGSFAEPAAVSAPAPAGAFESQIATDRLSNALAAWTVDPDVNDPFNPTWVEAAFAPAGGQFDPPVRLSDPSRNAYEPRIAFESDGDAVVTWTAEDESGTLRVHAAFRTGGNGFVSTVLSPDGAHAFDPQVSAGHGTVVVWSRSHGVNVAAMAAVKPENAGFLPPQMMSRDGEEANEPQVAVGKDGTAVATWYGGSGDHVAAAIGRTTDGGFAPAATLSPPGMAASHPRVAVDERGSAVAVWIAGEGAFIQTAFRPRAADFGPAQTIATENVDEPQVVFDESGNALVAWTRYVSDVGQIETAFRPRGGSFGDPTVVSATGQPLSYYAPRIAADDSAAVVWTAENPTGFQSVQSAFRPKGEPFGPVETLTERLLYASQPQVAVDERGNVRAVWTLTDQANDAPATIQSAFRPRI
jgi:hypothetical protein